MDAKKKKVIREVPTVRSASRVSPSTDYFLVLALMILHEAMNSEAEEHLHRNHAQVDT